MLLCPPVIIYFIMSTVYNPPGKLIGQVGCQFASLLLMFNVVCFQSRSFFMAMFRYLCIVHNERLSGMAIKVTQLVWNELVTERADFFQLEPSSSFQLLLEPSLSFSKNCQAFFQAAKFFSSSFFVLIFFKLFIRNWGLFKQLKHGCSGPKSQYFWKSW